MSFFSLGTVMGGWMVGGRVKLGCGLGSSPGFLGIDGIVGVGGVGSGPVLSALPKPTAGLGPLGGKGSGAGAPGIGVFGISGVTFLGISTPRGF